MTLEEQFHAARDITPGFGYISVTQADGKTVCMPCPQGEVGALFVAEDQGTYMDEDGSKWLVGTQRGELVKRRYG